MEFVFPLATNCLLQPSLSVYVMSVAICCKPYYWLGIEEVVGSLGAPLLSMACLLMEGGMGKVLTKITCMHPHCCDSNAANNGRIWEYEEFCCMRFTRVATGSGHDS